MFLESSIEFLKLEDKVECLTATYWPYNHINLV